MKFKVGDSVSHFKVETDEAKYYDLYDYIIVDIDEESQFPYCVERQYDKKRFWAYEDELELSHELDEIYGFPRIR